nr:MAG TPA: hypothetical protein [Caudoviricetes sp.]
MKVILICLRIDNDELKTTEKNEWIKFIRRHRGNVKSIEQFTWKIPESKLQKALEYSYDELYKFKLKENKKTSEGKVHEVIYSD